MIFSAFWSFHTINLCSVTCRMFKLLSFSFRFFERFTCNVTIYVKFPSCCSLFFSLIRTLYSKNHASIYNKALLFISLFIHFFKKSVIYNELYNNTLHCQKENVDLQLFIKCIGSTNRLNGAGIRLE